MNRRDFEAMYGEDIPPDPDDMYLRGEHNAAAVLSSCVGLLVIGGLFWLVVGLAAAWVMP